MLMSTMQADFAANLRHVCSAWPSLAMFCRETGINRSQFNRYLNGRTRPSNHILARICDAVGIAERELFIPESEFKAKFPFKQRKIAENRDGWERFIRLNKDALDKFGKYAGYYYIYYNSMSRVGKIIKGVLHIYENKNGVQFTWIEKDNSSDQSKLPLKWRYKGHVYILSERIFLVGVETLTENEIVEIALFPSFRSKILHLSGLIIGVSSSNRREINCSRVVFERIQFGTNKRRMLQECGIFNSENISVSSSIQRVIQSDIEAKYSLFSASMD